MSARVRMGCIPPFLTVRQGCCFFGQKGSVHACTFGPDASVCLRCVSGCVGREGPSAG